MRLKTNRKWDLLTSLVGVTVMLLWLHAFTAGRAAAVTGENLANSSDSSYFFDRRNKVLLYGVAPGQVVTVYGVDGSDTPVFNDQGAPSGQFAGDYLGPQDGKPLEVYIPLSPATEGPTARQSRFFLWSGDRGWRLLAALAPVESFPDTHVYAQ